MRDAAGELDDVQATLDVALGVRNDLAVLRREQPGEFIHIPLDEVLEPEHDAGAALRVESGPLHLGRLRVLYGTVQLGCVSKADLRLDLTCRGIEDIAEPRTCRA